MFYKKNVGPERPAPGPNAQVRLVQVARQPEFRSLRMWAMHARAAPLRFAKRRAAQNVTGVRERIWAGGAAIMQQCGAVYGTVHYLRLPTDMSPDSWHSNRLSWAN
jgi:hypothetical protein